MNWGNSWKFALVLSVLAHGVFVFFLLMLPASVWQVEVRGGHEKRAGSSDLVKRLVIRKQAEKKPKKAEEPKQENELEEKKQPEFVKTSANQPKDDRIKESPLVGSRATKASGGAKAPDDMKEMPAQEGVESKDGEIVLFDQDRQDGDLTHDDEGRAKVVSPSSPVVQRVVQKNAQRPVLADLAMTEANQPSDDAEGSEIAAEDGVASPHPAEDVHPEKNPEQQPEKNSERNPDQNLVKEEPKESVNDSPQDLPRKDQVPERLADAGREGKAGKDGDQEKSGEEAAKKKASEIAKNDPNDVSKADAENDVPISSVSSNALSLPGKSLMANDRVKSLPPVADAGKTGFTPERIESLPAPSVSGGGSSLPPPLKRKNKRPVYDPVFSEMAQPGFRTQERRTKTSGRFSFGRNPSLDVAATPMGRYQEIVYRAIAMVWYDQCDRNRDLIVTGTLRIRILLNPKGNVVSMKLLGRSGASVAQNSFTFVAIKAAPIPPMPPEVRKELIGDRMELFFDFNF